MNWQIRIEHVLVGHDQTPVCVYIYIYELDIYIPLY